MVRYLIILSFLLSGCYPSDSVSRADCSAAVTSCENQMESQTIRLNQRIDRHKRLLKTKDMEILDLRMELDWERISTRARQSCSLKPFNKKEK